MMKENPTIQPDIWLGEMLQKTSYRVVFSQDTELCTTNIFTHKSPAFYYCKIPVTQVDAISYVEKRGFHLLDTNIVLDMPIKNVELSGYSDVRFSIHDDEDIVAIIARDNFVYTRFHLDPIIDNSMADKIKEQWVRNFYKGQRGDAMVVATVNDVPIGFLQLLYKKDQVIIDLIAVDKQHRGKSVAADMIAFAMREKNDCSKIIVGTQIANIPSLRFYERMGFRIFDSTYVFHYHTE